MIDARLARERREAVDVASLLRRIVEGFRLREGERVRFALDADAMPLITDASEDRLTQVFENILDNAASFTPAGEEVAVRVARAGDVVEVTVSDRGPGIPEANLSRIFDRFFTHRPEASRHESGHTGLGLAIVKRIVEGYGGTVTAANGPSGTEFRVRLPLGSS